MPLEPQLVHPPQLLNDASAIQFEALSCSQRERSATGYTPKVSHSDDTTTKLNIWPDIVSSFMATHFEAPVKPVPALAACLTPCYSAPCVEEPPSMIEATPEFTAYIDGLFDSSTRISDYTYVKTLGEGTFGKVKLAEHKHTKEQVAVKIIDKVNIKSVKQRNSLCREIRLLRLLNHPHILKVIDVVETAEQILIFTEYASGGELFDYIVQHKCVKEPEARTFFRQIISAMDYCHQNTIIHRDLKPENLLLDSNKKIKIIDFGFVNMYRLDGVLDTFCGSPFYAAPEMVRGIKYTGPEVDVWSLGVILYALLSGRLPFDAETMPKLYDKISAGEYRVPSSFSADAADLIAAMLTVDPTKRATMATIRTHRWVTENQFDFFPNYMPLRQMPVILPRPDIITVIKSFGFTEQLIRETLASNTRLHPIMSYYHLISEAKVRARETRKRIDSLYQSQLLSQMSSSARNIDCSNFQLPAQLVPEYVYSLAPHTPVSMPAASIISVNIGSMTNDNAEQLRSPDRPTSTKHMYDQHYSQVQIGVNNQPAFSNSVSASNSPRRFFLSRPRSSVPDSSASQKSQQQQSLPQTNRPQVNSPTKAANEAMINARNTLSEQMQAVSGFFSVSMTSNKPLPYIMSEVERALMHNSFKWLKTGNFTYYCEEPVIDAETGNVDKIKGTKFELEICKVDRLAGFCIQTRRIKGSVWGYKKLCGKLLSDMYLS